MDEIINGVDAVRRDLHLGWEPLSQAIKIPSKRLRRWHSRMSQSRPPQLRPGPQKQVPLPPTLEQEVRDLKHGCKRSRGVGELQRRHETVISRRDLAALVRQSRREHHQRLRESWRRVQWHTPQIAWGFDGAETARDHRGTKMMLHPMSDMASRYRFEPLVSLTVKGSEIAVWLKGQFDLYGAPLFLKRDNGSPLNHARVNELLAEYGVIPLNSPPHYPRYNGMIENCVRELKDDAGLRQAPPEGWEINTCVQRVRLAIRTRNHKPRRCLSRQTAHDVYTSRCRSWSIEQRRAILDWLHKKQCEIIQSIKETGSRAHAKAWRQAVELWLVSNAHIRIHKPTNKNQIVLPYFPNSLAHN